MFTGECLQLFRLQFSSIFEFEIFSYKNAQPNVRVSKKNLFSIDFEEKNQIGRHLEFFWRPLRILFFAAFSINEI
jgi:hypothetical protein